MPIKDPEARREYYRKLHAKNPKRVYQNVKKNKAKIRAWFNEYKTGLKCSRCPENHPACLEFHHKGEKKSEISRMVGDCLSVARILEEISKCIILCANCHRKEHWKK